MDSTLVFAANPILTLAGLIDFYQPQIVFYVIKTVYALYTFETLTVFVVAVEHRLFNKRVKRNIKMSLGCAHRITGHQKTRASQVAHVKCHLQAVD